MINPNLKQINVWLRPNILGFLPFSTGMEDFYIKLWEVNQSALLIFLAALGRFMSRPQFNILMHPCFVSCHHFPSNGHLTRKEKYVLLATSIKTVPSRIKIMWGGPSLKNNFINIYIRKQRQRSVPVKAQNGFTLDIIGFSHTYPIEAKPKIGVL